MVEKAQMARTENLPAAENRDDQPRKLRLISGRELKISSREDEDLVEIYEPGGQLVIKVQLTENGPVMMVEGCRLELNGSESIALRAPTIEISAEEKARLSSRGELEIDAVEEMGIHSDADIRGVGKIIHLN